MNGVAVVQRAQQARAFLLVAELALADTSNPGGMNVAGSNAVLAGIAASDAICGHTLAVRSAGEAHTEAIALLKRATPPGSKATTHLKRLLSSKTDTHYSPDLVGTTKAAELVTSARNLLAEMEELLRR